MSIDSATVSEFVSGELQKHANPTNAVQMQAYLKTEMPFYGVKSPTLNSIVKDVKESFQITTQAEYNDVILHLWSLSHREEKYVSVKLAIKCRKFITLDALPVFEKMIREGQWWDFIDPISTNLIGKLLEKYPTEMNSILDKWIEDEDMWIRRSAILSHLKHKENTDQERLFEYCLKCAREKEFFIRKAIGWALREYSKTKPEVISNFIQEHDETLSNLSKREGMKHINSKK